MPTFKIPVTYQMWGIYIIEADTLEEAKKKAFTDVSLGLPDNASYLDDSMEIDEEDVRLHNDNVETVCDICKHDANDHAPFHKGAGCLIADCDCERSEGEVNGD